MTGQPRLAILVAVTALWATSCAWTQYRGSPGRSGYDSTSSGLTADTVGQLEVLMSTKFQPAEFPVLDHDNLYFADDGSLRRYPVTAGLGCTGVTCPPTTSWLVGGRMGPPAFDATRLYGATSVNLGAEVFAFDRAGCVPGAVDCYLWRGVLPAGHLTAGRLASVALADGRVFVGTPGTAAVGNIPLAPAAIDVFDAAGIEGCDGATPSVCAPLYSAVSDIPAAASPTVADGYMYLPTAAGIAMYDATGVGCPAGQCPILATFPMTGAPAGDASAPVVRDGRLFAVRSGSLAAFDARGEHGCSGTPKVCTPLWTAPLAGSPMEEPVVTDRSVSVLERGESSGIGIEVFSPAGGSGCSGIPKVCERRWSVPWTAMPGTSYDHAAASRHLLVVSGYTVSTGSWTPRLAFFDLDGTTGCSTATRSCQPLRTMDLPSSVGSAWAPAIAFDRIVVGSAGNSAVVVGLPS